MRRAGRCRWAVGRFGACSSSATTVGSSSARATCARQRRASSRWCASSTSSSGVREPRGRRRRPDGRSASSPWATSTSRPSCAGWPGPTRGGSCSSSGPATPPPTWPGRTPRPSRRCASDDKEVVYQATFFDGGFVGHADFLERTGDGWLVSDTKLARTESVPALLQIAAYASLLQRGRRARPPPSPGSSSAAATCATSPSTTSCPSTAPGGRGSTRCCSTTAPRPGPARWGDPRWLACGRCEVCEPEVEAARDLLLVAGVRAPTRRKLHRRRRHDDRRARRAHRAGRRRAGRDPRAAARAGPPPARAGARPRRRGPLRGHRPRHPAPDAAAQRRRRLLRLRGRPAVVRARARAPGGWSTSSASSRSTPAQRGSAPSGPTTARPSGRPSSTSSTWLNARRAALARPARLPLRRLRDRGPAPARGPPRRLRGRGRPAAARRRLRRPLRRRALGDPGVAALLLDQEARAALHGGPRGGGHQRGRLDRRLPPVHGRSRRRAARRGRARCSPRSPTTTATTASPRGCCATGCSPRARHPSVAGSPAARSAEVEAAGGADPVRAAARR